MEEPENIKTDTPNEEEIKGNLIEEEVDELAVDIPDIPLPSAEHTQEAVIEDEFDSAYKFAIVGSDSIFERARLVNGIPG